MFDYKRGLNAGRREALEVLKDHEVDYAKQSKAAGDKEQRSFLYGKSVAFGDAVWLMLCSPLSVAPDVSRGGKRGRARAATSGQARV